MFKELNPLLHSELRLAVMSLLISVEEADFVYIRQQTKATAGNLSVQIDKLSKAGYVARTFIKMYHFCNSHVCVIKFLS